jgi:hypothetical protein
VERVRKVDRAATCRLRDLMLEDSERRRYIDSSELRGSSE